MEKSTNKRSHTLLIVILVIVCGIGIYFITINYFQYQNYRDCMNRNNKIRQAREGNPNLHELQRASWAGYEDCDKNKPKWIK